MNATSAIAGGIYIRAGMDYKLDEKLTNYVSLRLNNLTSTSLPVIKAIYTYVVD